MVKAGLTEMIIIAKEDSSAMLQIIEILNPLISAYTKKLFFMENEDARQEIIIAIIEAVKRIDKCENDGRCLTYIHNAVKFRFAHLCKKNLKNQEILDLNGEILNNMSYWEDYSEVEIKYEIELKEENMTQTQKQILKYCLMGYTDREIAEKLGLSRQYVNRIKKFLIAIKTNY